MCEHYKILILTSNLYAINHQRNFRNISNLPLFQSLKVMNISYLKKLSSLLALYFLLLPESKSPPPGTGLTRWGLSSAGRNTAGSRGRHWRAPCRWGQHRSWCLSSPCLPCSAGPPLAFYHCSWDVSFDWSNHKFCLQKYPASQSLTSSVSVNICWRLGTLWSSTAYLLTLPWNFLWS